MSKFTKSFYLRFLLEGGLFIIALVTVMQAFNHLLVIDVDKKLYVYIYALTIIIVGVIYPMFMYFIAAHNTKVIRRAEYTLGNTGEFSFYRNYILVVILINIAVSFFLYYKSQPFFQTALDDAFWQIRNSDFSKEYTSELIGNAEKLKNNYVSAFRNALIIEGVLNAVIMFFCAGRLVKVYQARLVNKYTQRRMKNLRK